MKPQSDLISIEEKRLYYTYGQYEMNAPPVHTYGWNIDSWVAHIDATGRWITPLAAKIEAENPSDIPLKDCAFYRWLGEGNYTARYIADLKTYLFSLGLVVGKDLLSEEVVRCLRYQHEWFYRQEIMQDSCN